MIEALPYPVSRSTGEGDNPKKFCLLPFEEWEKVADRPDEGAFFRVK